MPTFKPCCPFPPKKLKWKQIAPFLGEAREAVARLDEKWDKPLFLELLFWHEAIASLRTQNIERSLKEVLLYAFANRSDDQSEPFLQKILLVKEALDQALDWGLKRVLGQRFFCHLHGIVKRDGAKPSDIGRIRNRQNWIGRPGCSIEDAYFCPPSAAEVRPLLRNLEEYLQKKGIDPLVQTAIAFAQFLIIHPFMDGNGRVARIFIPMFAMKRGLLSHPVLLLSFYFAEHRKDYFQKLFHLTTKESWEDWIIYFLKGVTLESKRIRRQCTRLQKLFDRVESLIGKKMTEKLFRSPVLKKNRSRAFSLLVKEKVLIAQAEEIFLFEPLIRAMRPY